MAAHHGWIRTGDTPDGGCRLELGFTRTGTVIDGNVMAVGSAAGSVGGKKGSP